MARHHPRHFSLPQRPQSSPAIFALKPALNSITSFHLHGQWPCPGNHHALWEMNVPAAWVCSLSPTRGRPSWGREKEELTSDQQFSATGIGMMMITTGANVDPRIRGLDAGEVELGAWWGTDGNSLKQMHPPPITRPCGRAGPQQGRDRPVPPRPLGGSWGWGHGYLDVAAGCYWARAAHPHETSRSSGVGSH